MKSIAHNNPPWSRDSVDSEKELTGSRRKARAEE